jgi:transposase
VSCIIESKSGGHVYLYESESYRDKEGKVKNKRRIVGKIDSKTGERIFKPWYIEEKGISALGESAQTQQIYSYNDVKSSTVKEYGSFYLLNSIANQIGLIEIMTKLFPKTWNELMNLAFYMVASGEPAMYCEDWLYKSECLISRTLSSQRISELVASITAEDRMNFYEAWGEYRCENEYIALDITSVSTYSEQINDAEWGYNRDKEKLPQINICMLVGEKSRLPIMQVVYSGSLKDVSTLKSTLEMASSLSLNNISLVMDKGFSSTKNINQMLADVSMRFLMAIPFTLGFAKKQVTSECKDIDRIENTIIVGQDVLRGVTKKRSWNTEKAVYAHIYLDTDTALRAKNKLYAKVRTIIECVKEEPDKYTDHADAKKYLIIRKSDKNDNGCTINVRTELIEEELSHSGWLVLMSNHIKNAPEAIRLYRDKDIVEKSFQSLKNCLDFARLRVHSDNSMQNKIFIGFIALIITAHIHKKMHEYKFYEQWTMKKMIKILERLKIHYIKDDKIISPLTKEHKEIFRAFEIKFNL